MATLLEKVSTLISANVHALVDQALKANSISVIDQYIRQVEDQLEALEDAAATVGGEVKSIERKLDELKVKHTELDQAVDKLLADENETAAIAAQSKLNSTQQLMDTYQTQLSTQQSEYQKLLDAKVQLDGRLAAMKQQREELQALLDLARSKEKVVKTMRSLDDLMGSGDSDIAGMAKHIYSRLDKANAATEIRSANLDEQIERVLERDKIKGQLAERKEKLKEKKAKA
jgi:phage shock protein A